MSRLSDNSLTLDILSQPNMIQSVIIEDLNEKLQGKVQLVDPNNAAANLMEMCGTIVSNYAKATEQAVNELIPTRAQSTSELYKHMSDFDYINMFSMPSMANISLILDKQYLDDNAVDFNENYKKVVIPKSTVINMSGLNFGIYYPIEIRINRVTKTPLVVYDTSDLNPIFKISSNLIPFIEISIMDTKYLKLEIPVYQFSQSLITEALTPNLGFTKRYDYNDKFYACRIFTIKNGNKIELHQSLSKDTYDPYTPTARITIEPDTKRFTVNIPQIYFSTDKMGTTLLIELYTTKGDISNNLSSTTIDQSNVNFNINATKDIYSKLLQKIPVIQIAPISEKLSGGSNGYGFEELRQRVINNSFYTSALVTPIDVTNYFKDKGLNAVKYEDDLTNLIYFGYKLLTDGNSSVIPSTNSYISITEESYLNTDTIKYNLDSSLTILPTSILKYNADEDVCYVLNNDDLAIINSLPKEKLVESFNNNSYLKSPFHIRVGVESEYPTAISYNLMTPSIYDFNFEKENNNISAQIVILGGSIIHNNEGSGGYTVSLVTSKSKDLEEVPSDDIYIYVYCKDTEDNYIGIKAEYKETIALGDVYTFNINTDYHLTESGTINTTSLLNNSTMWNYYIKLISKFTAVFMIDSAYYPTTITNNELYEGVTSEYLDKVVMLRQTFTLKLGESLTDVLYNNIDLQWSSKEYLKHPIDVYLTYNEDVYKTDALGVPIITIDKDGNPSLEKIHSIGDTILDAEGNPRIKYKQGTNILDEFGNPIQTKDRLQKFYIQACLLDARLYITDDLELIAFRKDLIKSLLSYFEIIRSSSSQLLERDKIYFRLIKTIGNTQYKIGDGITVTLPLAVSVKLKIHVPLQVTYDPIQLDNIRNVVINTIEEHLINRYLYLSEVITDIKFKLPEIISIDVLGICGSTTLQTIAPIDPSVQPMLERKLYLTKDNKIYLEKNVDIEFVYD